MTSENSAKKRHKQAGWLPVTHRTVDSLENRYSPEPLPGSAGSACSFSSAGSVCSAGPAGSLAGRTRSSAYSCGFGSWCPSRVPVRLWALCHSLIIFRIGHCGEIVFERPAILLFPEVLSGGASAFMSNRGAHREAPLTREVQLYVQRV